MKDLLAADIHHLAVTIGPRHGGEPEAWQAAERWAINRLIGLGWSVRREPLHQAPDRANIVAERPGDGRWLLLGAHLDTLPRVPGADDNASGVAAVLALAAAWAQRPLPGPGLRVVLFADEELMARDRMLGGSWQHAAACTARQDRIEVALILDTLAYRDERAGTQHWPAWWMRWIHGGRGNTISVQSTWAHRFRARQARSHLRRIGQRTVSCWWPGQRWQLKGDQASFLAHGIPSVAITDTDRFRNPHYHRPSDLPTTLDVAWLADTVRGIDELVAQWTKARSLPKPRSQ